MIKKSINKWRDDYERQLQIAESQMAPKISRYYQREYNKGVANFIETGNTDYQSLFKFDFFKNIYIEIYANVSMRFANWYARNNEKYSIKANPKQFTQNWRSAFNYYAGKVAATNVVLVSGTAKKTLISLTQRLYRDPNFVSLGANERARILRKQFKKYSNYQAIRLVRTESTRAANFGIEQSALSVYAGQKLKKQWITALDGREREWHAAAHNQIVDMDKPFIVGGEAMQRPGEGSARNVINCRCSMIPYPVEEPANPLASNNLNIVGGIIVANELSN